MIKYYTYICSFCLFLIGHIIAYAQFPYQSTLTSENDFTQFDTSYKVVFDSNGATLTPASNGTTRGFYLSDLAFTIDRGFIIEFDYLMTGGAGFADGLALVLYDGSVVTPKMGSDGSGLGYSYKTVSSSGLTKGFLAVGVDLWGNFKYRRAEGNEYRNGILEGASNNTLKDGKVNEVKNHITIRGQGDGGKGYPVLITQSTEDFDSRTQLNFATGLYDVKPQAPQATPFSFKLRENMSGNENDLGATFGHASYRRVEISMLPGKKGNDIGFYMSVDMIYGSTKSRIIKDYFLPKEATINYTEATSQTANSIQQLKLVAPKTFKLGFAASTGGYNQRHIVRNLSLYMPFSPSIQDLFIEEVCRDTPKEIDVLENSVGFNTNEYSGTGNMHSLGKKEFLDLYSFQFRTIVGTLYEDTAHPYIAVTENGTYEYNPETGIVVFVPSNKALTATRDQVYFTIRNKEVNVNGVNLGSEQFRSNTATVRLTFGNKCNSVIMVNGNPI